MHLLFVCTYNKWRSLTAEHLFQNDQRLHVRSAGTSAQARRVVSLADIEWADQILVMEQRHKEFLQANFPREILANKIQVLDIPSGYQYMDEELIVLLRENVEALFK